MSVLWIPINVMLDCVERECPWDTCEGLSVDNLSEYVDEACETTSPYNPSNALAYDIWYHAGRVKYFMRDDIDVEPIYYASEDGLSDGYHRLFGQYLAGYEYIQCDFCCEIEEVMELLGLNTEEEYENYTSQFSV